MAGTTLRYPHAVPPARGEATEIAEGVLWARLPLPMALDHVNVYLLDDGDGWCVVDTGFDSRKTRAVWQALLSGPMAGRPVTKVLVTHHHPDHIGLAGWFQAQGAELITTRTAWLMARMLVLDDQDRPLPETLDFWRGAGMDAATFAQRAGERPFNFADVVAPLPLGYTRIAEGSVVRIAGRDWDVRIGNGHAPEHATLWSRDDGLVIGGDQLIPSISPNLGVYATEPLADPVGEWLESCERFLPLADDTALILPGHKLPFHGLPLRLRQLIANHHGALDRLHGYLSEPKTAAECFRVMFKREIGPGEYGLALVESYAHCQHLWHGARATKTRRNDGAWLWQAAG